MSPTSSKTGTGTGTTPSSMAASWTTLDDEKFLRLSPKPGSGLGLGLDYSGTSAEGGSVMGSPDSRSSVECDRKVRCSQTKS